MEIESKWEYTTGVWDNKSNNYKNIKHRKEKKIIKMEIINRSGKQVLNFIGGPTGFESYYVKNLIEIGIPNSFCICSGTINTWPRCEVNGNLVSKFINSYKEGTK